MPAFIDIAGYTINADEILYAHDDTVLKQDGTAEEERAVRVEFIRKGVIYLRGVNKATLDEEIGRTCQK